jgi:hypothetical protein
MRLLPIRKVLRLFLAVSVSAWMAGAGCLLGCSNEAHATPSAGSAVETIAAGHPCAMSHSHDCCVNKRKARTASLVPSNSNSQIQVSAIPSRALESCPMAVNAAAILSKAHSDSSNVALTRSEGLPCADYSAPPPLTSVDTSNLFNRGPTYIRCCVFLI